MTYGARGGRGVRKRQGEPHPFQTSQGREPSLHSLTAECREGVDVGATAHATNPAREDGLGAVRATRPRAMAATTAKVHSEVQSDCETKR